MQRSGEETDAAVRGAITRSSRADSSFETFHSRTANLNQVSPPKASREPNHSLLPLYAHIAEKNDDWSAKDAVRARRMRNAF